MAEKEREKDRDRDKDKVKFTLAISTSVTIIMMEPKARYTSEVQAMMYTFGDVRTPVPASAQLIEQLVHKQLIDVIIRAAHVAQRVRSARSLNAEDVIFAIRKDRVKVARLKEFLSWRDLRKNVRSGEEPNAHTLDGAEEELLGLAQIETTTGNSASGPGPVLPTSSGSGRSRATRRRHCALPWDYLAGLVLEGTEGRVDLLEEEPVDPDAAAESLRRLHEADNLTRSMTRDEYMEYSECRQASFTYKKAKKFRDWLNPAQYIDFRLNDDVIEILGFLAWELVRLITQVSLTVKRQEASRPVEGSVSAGGLLAMATTEACELFASPTEKTAILPQHIRTAIRHINQRTINPLRRLVPSHQACHALRLY